MWRIDEVKMKILSDLILITFIHHYCIKEAVPSYVLLKGTRSEVERECSNVHRGTITIFRGDLPDELSHELHDYNSILIWNGYKYTSSLVENTGCFKKIRSHRGYYITISDLTIAFCEHFCNRNGIANFAIQESQCLCVDPDGIDSPFLSVSNAQHCNFRCNEKPDEYCGSKENSTFYNIYAVVESAIFADLDITGEKACLLYKHGLVRDDEIEAAICNEDLANRIGCRSRNNTVEWIYYPWFGRLTWKAATDKCLDSDKSNSYLASYSDVASKNWGINWLNERKYSTILEKKNDDEDLEECLEILVENGEIDIDYRNCDDSEGIQYVCRTGNINEIKSTNTYSQTVTSASQDSSTGTNSQKHSPSKPSHQQNVSSDIELSPDDENNSDTGLLIGGVGGAVTLITITGGVFMVFVLRRRHSGPCNKKSEYQSQEVRYSTSNGVTNSAYGSGSAYEIIQGNQNRNSQGDYTKINDEDLRISGNIHSKANICDDPKGFPPPNGPLYMVLEKETTSEIASFSPFTNYESARPILDQKSNEKNVSENDECKRNADDMEYDHLRQEAYELKVTDENVYNHTDTDNEYSHISQITKTNDNHKDDADDDDEYTHTGDFEAHSGTSVQNDMDGTYAHANDNYDNGDGMNGIRPYELALNVHRHETDTDESKPNACAQLNTEDGDYSFAKPID